MNDFTKAELLIMHLAIIRDINQFDHILKTSPSMLELRDKLETMIDNYCEHEESKSNHNYEVEQCKKCGRLFV
tara:strand:+ start:7848 stop:8066 length:219 start_codon:yes stop_codon:yes gene_type:complete